MWSDCRNVAERRGFALPDFETFRETGRVAIPLPPEHRVQFADFVSDPMRNPLQTESGRITLWNDTIASMRDDDCPGHPAWREPVEWLGNAQDGQLHLISGQPDTRLHSQLDNGSEARSSKIQGKEPCVLHPDTAATLGVCAGDIVRLYNTRGACLASVTLSADIHPRCVSLATGAWFDPQVVEGLLLEVHGNPNVLTFDKGTSSLAQGTIAHTCLIRVEKWTFPVPSLRVDAPPRFKQTTKLLAVPNALS